MRAWELIARGTALAGPLLLSIADLKVIEEYLYSFSKVEL
jgi:hypothetical protein